MIVVKIIGGIGNQLFQYFFGQYLEIKFKQPVFYDIIAFNTVNKERSFELKLLFPAIRIYEGNQFKFSRYKKLKGKILVSFFKINKKNHYISNCTIDKIENIKFEETYYFNGFWQEPKMIDETYSLLKENFILNEKVPLALKDLEKDIKGSNSVSIHVRRGDYFTPKNIKTYGVCTDDYYYNAISEIEKKFDSKMKYFVFTDDAEWVKSNLILPSDSVIVSNFKINSFWDIHLMSLCKNNIISNSSFSWWGAYLNRNSQKIVIAPKRWTLKSIETIALDCWIKL